jgi:hypothetical protein
MLMFKRARGKDEIKDCAPPGTIFACNSESAYITKELFLVWIVHFIDSVKPSREKNVLLLLDGHSTHTKNLEALEMARENGVILLSLPEHTMRRLQPSDVSFLKPLSFCYIDEMEKWLRANPGRCVTQFQVAAIFGRAYCRAPSIGNAVNGFSRA